MNAISSENSKYYGYTIIIFTLSQDFFFSITENLTIIQEEIASEKQT